MSAATLTAHAQVASKDQVGKIGNMLTSGLQGAQAKATAPLGPTTQSSPARSKSKGADPSSQLSMAEMPVIDGKVVINAIATDDANALLADLEALGMTHGSVYGRVVSGRMPVAQVGQMNGLTSMISAAPALNSANVGLTTSQGDASQMSDVARSMYGLDGSGVTVGTLSDSYDCSGAGGGAAADVANDDLPAGVNVLDDSAGCSDEGRAMMQLIHDVAPGSNQAFHTAFNGTADFANGIIELQAAGSDIIVDDIIYFAEPMFQDGIIAQAAQAVADNGSAYFSSAGNNGRSSLESAFTPTGIPGVFGGNLHDWDPGPGTDTLLDFTLEGFGTTFIVLQWDSPAASAGGVGADSDLDFFLWFDGAPIFAVSSFTFNIGGDPVEIIGVNNNGSALPVQLSVELWAGNTPSVIRYVTFGSDERFGEGAQEYNTSSGSSYGHANAANVAGVGAAAYFNTEVFNPFCQPACLNSFSSAGGVPILFDTAGNPINEVRGRPNFVGPDGGNTTFFGFDWEPDGFPNFFGTSASAPHAAAGAALLLETDPSLTPGEIYQLLADTAQDMNDPGFDFDTGAGFIDIAAAVDLAATDPKNDRKRFVCHNGDDGPETISIRTRAVQKHLNNHGDKYGPCE